MLRTVVLATTLGALCTFAVAADPTPVVTYSKKAKFEDVRDDLKTAIESKGLVIDYQSHINTMLERTGKDVGSSRKLYVDAQSLHGHRREVARAQAQVHGELLEAHLERPLSAAKSRAQEASLSGSRATRCAGGRVQSPD
jgi:hypothetical protein